MGVLPDSRVRASELRGGVMYFMHIILFAPRQ